ncbi:MAG: malate dehydrogenase [Bacteroidetes bacterium]|nr:malate dehydrogenase [Bacteroidota bacterium]
MKITVIGAGNVGATCADVMARKELANEIILVDIIEGIAEGKALDMWETAPVDGTDTRVIGVTNDYSKTKDSDIIVITSGVPRKPGMSRDDLIGTNAKIVKDVTEKAVKYSPDAIIIVVANPLDVMTYTASLVSKKNRNQVFGMAGILDTSRLKAFVAAELNVSTRDIQTLLLGGHGDTMVPLPSYTTVSGIPLSQFLDKEKIEAIVQRTRGGGGEIVKLQGTSAWYAPGAAVAQMVESIVRNQHRILPVCVELKGEYGMKDVFLGVPVKLGKEGIEEIIEVALNDEEKQLLTASSNAVKNVMGVLDNMNLF